MSAAKHASILGKRGDDVLNDLSRVGGVGLFVGDVHVVAAGQDEGRTVNPGERRTDERN
jgi:hypothetical protein